MHPGLYFIILPMSEKITDPNKLFHKCGPSARLVRIFSFLQSVLWLLLLLPADLFCRAILAEHFIISGGVLILTGLALLSLVIVWLKKEPWEFNLADFFFAGYSGYILFNVFFVRPYPMPDIFRLKFLAVILLWYTVRLLDAGRKNVFLLLLAGTGLSEAFLILLQHWGMVESRHLLFNFTGSFPNPGPAAGFIACALCVSLHFFYQSYRKVVKIILIAGMWVMGYALLLTDSRAGWIAAFCGCTYLMWRPANKKKTAFKVITLIILLGGTLFLYQHKKASADGRLFIWQNSIEMLKDKPLFGQGIGMFRSLYPGFQAAFFRENPDSAQAMVAGNPSTSFNEYLMVLSTQGVVGFIFLSVVLLVLFLFSLRQNIYRPQRAFLLTFGVFAFFSYPTAHFRLLLLLPFFAALLPVRPIACNRKVVFILLAVLPLPGMYYGVKALKEYKTLETCFQEQTVLPLDTYHKIKYDLGLLQKYHISTARYLDTTAQFALMKEYVELYPSAYGLCEIGKKYRALHLYGLAKTCFIAASEINPALITPPYELFLLYQLSGDTLNLRKTGKSILLQPLKKESTTSLRMKAEVRKILGTLR